MIYKIKLKWAILFSFFTVVVLLSIFTFSSIQMLQESSDYFPTKISKSKKQLKNNLYSDYFDNYQSVLESLAVKENSWNGRKNPLLNSLGKIYFEDEQHPTVSPLWGDSTLFPEGENPWLEEVIQNVRKTPEKIFFHSYQTDDNPYLYFFYMNKESPSFIYAGEINILALEDKLIGVAEPAKDKKTYL